VFSNVAPLELDEAQKMKKLRANIDVLDASLLDLLGKE
jgi:chorismate mutase